VAIAAPGTVLVSDAVRMAANGLAFDPAAPVVLKGIGEVVPVFVASPPAG
jgi:class 3 adenylate cyclase